MSMPPRPPQPHATGDFETYSESGLYWDGSRYLSKHGSNKVSDKGLAGVGAAVYAEHPSTEVLTFSYRVPGQPIRRWRPGLPLPQDLFDWLAAGGLFEAHNVMFERLIWEKVCVPKYGFPPLPAAQLRCSMAKARVNALPAALGNLTGVLGTAVVKDADGRRLLNKFSVPQKPTKKQPAFRILPEDDPEDAEKLYTYCDVDVESEELASAAMPSMSAEELAFWQIDQEINHRGVAIDIESVRNMIVILDDALAKYDEEFTDLTGGLKPSQVQATVGWLAANGVQLPSLDADTVEDALKTAPHGPIRRVLEIRQLAGSASVKKLYSLDRMACADGRLRDILVHHGARTGRAAGEGPQPQNLPKAGPNLRWCECGKPSHAGRDTCAWCLADISGVRVSDWSERPAVDDVQEVMATRSLDAVEYFFGDPLLAISGSIRGMFVAGPGKDLIASDFTAIEAVVAAALAGEEWRLDVFRQGRPIYLESASRITGTSVEEYLAFAEENGQHHPDRNKIGKVAELACFGPQTQVLTDSGYKSIISVSEDDRLWDGVEWVNHKGLVKKGVQAVITLDGVKTTPTHKMLCGTSWLEASQLASNRDTLHQALATGSENLPSSAPPRAGVRAPERTCNAPAEPLLMRSIIAPCGEGKALDARSALSVNQGRAKAKIIGGTKIYAPTSGTEGVCSTASHLASTGVTTRTTGATITTAGAESESMNRGGPHGGTFSRTLSRSTGGTDPNLSLTGEKSIEGMSPGTSVSSLGPSTPATNEPSENSKPGSLSLSDVYDIAHAGPRNRFTIKTDSGHLIVHNCGFGGWIGALRAFSDDILDDEAKKLILGWRDASPAIVEMWGGQGRGWPGGRSYRQEYYGLEGIFCQAILMPDRTFETNGIKAYMRGDALILRLLSGREMTYQSPRLTPSERRPGEYAITFMTWNTNPKYGPRGWIPMSTYSGKLFENVVQATAHDLLRHAIINLREAGYPTVMHIHDEIVTEVPEGFGSVEEMEAIMSRRPAWAHDWPIAVDGGYRAKRYRK